MSLRRLRGNASKTIEVILIDANGNDVGTSASPLLTGTSALQTTADLTTVKLKTTTATTQQIAAANATNRNRVYRMRLEIGGAGILVILDGATPLEEFNVPAYAKTVYDFATRPWYTSSVNSALSYSISTAVTVNAVFEYTAIAP